MLTNDRVSQKEQEPLDQFTLHHSPQENDSILVPTDVFQTLSDRHLVRSAEDGNNLPLTASLSVSPDAIPETYECLEGLPVVPQLTVQELKDKQGADKAIQEVILQLESGKSSLPVLRKELPELPFLLREWKKLELRDGILYRKRVVGDHIIYQLVLPKDLMPIVMEHLYLERTLDLARARFYWPRMATDVEVKIKTCNRCFVSIPKHCPLNVYKLQCITALVRLLMTAASHSAFSIKNSVEDTQESPGLHF